MTTRDSSKSTSRRNVIKGAAGVAAVAILPSSVQATVESQEQQEDPDVEPEVMTNATHRFDPQTVSVGDTAYARGTGSWTTPLIGDVVQFDMFIAADKVGKPTITASNLPNTNSGFSYESGTNNPLGEPAYHYTTGQFLIVAPFGTTRYLDVKMPTYSTGRVEGQSGTLWPWWDFAVGYLDIQ